MSSSSGSHDRSLPPASDSPAGDSARTSASSEAAPGASPREYDAILILSFGGPEGRQDVIPFLENVLRGRNVPRERMLEVAEHYYHFDGVSPINEQNRALIAALVAQLNQHGPHLPVYWGNRNWHPLLADTLRQMADDGIRHALAFATSAWSSYSSCRQYQDDIARARAEVGADAPEVDKIRPFFNHPGFIETMIDRTRAAFEELPEERRGTARLVFTAHSIPMSMADNCRYEAQLQEASRLIAAGVAAVRGRGEPSGEDYRLVYQSRSGPPSQPWLEPDVGDYLREIRGQGAEDVVVVPVGFISDHMEVLYDLDTEAAQICEEIGLNMVRAGTAGTHPRFVTMIRELIVQRIEGRPAEVVGKLPPQPDVCLPGCCPAPVRPASSGGATSPVRPASPGASSASADRPSPGGPSAPAV